MDELSRTVTSDPSWRVRLQAVVVLGKLADPRAATALIRALSDVNESVRGVAAQVLGDLGNAQAIAALQRARNDSSRFVREKAAASLQRLHPDSLGATRAPSGLHVEVGGIGSKARHAPPRLIGRLKELIEAELRHTPGVTLEGKPLSGFMIDSAITTLSRKNSEQYVEISCEVSFVVGKLPSKAMVMMTSGGATVMTPKVGFRPALEESLQADALAGAVKGAHENLLAFLRTQTSMQTAGRLGQR